MIGLDILTVANGVFASHVAAFLAAMSFGAALIFGWRCWQIRGLRDRRRFFNFFWLTTLFMSVGANRVTVVLFYKGLSNALDWYPLIPSMGWAISITMLARSFTVDYCGNRGWGAAVFLSLLVMGLFG